MAQEQSTNVKLIDIGTDAEKILKTLLKGIKDIDTRIERGNDANEDNARRTRETQRNEAVRSEIAQRRQSAAQAAVHGEIRKGSTLLVGIKNVIGTIKDYVKDVSKRTIKSFDSLAQAQRKLLMSSEDIRKNQLSATKQQGILKDKNIRINRDDIGKITTSLAEETGTRFHELSEAQQSVLTVAMAKNKLSAQEALNLAMTVNEKNQDDILKTLIKGTDLTGQAVFKKTLQAQSEAWFKAYANQKGGTEVALKQMQESGQKLDALLGAQSVTAEDQFELLETLAKLQTGQLERTREQSIKSILAIAGGDNEVLRDPSKLADVIERGIINNKFTDENLRVLGEALGGENSSIAKGLATLNASYKQTGEIFKKGIDEDNVRADAVNVANEGGIIGNFIDTAITSFDEFTGGWFSRAPTAINEWFGEDLSLEDTVSKGFSTVTKLLIAIATSKLLSGGIGPILTKLKDVGGTFLTATGSKLLSGLKAALPFAGPALAIGAAATSIGFAAKQISDTYTKLNKPDEVKKDIAANNREIAEAESLLETTRKYGTSEEIAKIEQKLASLKAKGESLKADLQQANEDAKSESEKASNEYSKKQTEVMKGIIDEANIAQRFAMRARQAGDEETYKKEMERHDVLMKKADEVREQMHIVDAESRGLLASTFNLSPETMLGWHNFKNSISGFFTETIPNAFGKAKNWIVNGVTSFFSFIGDGIDTIGNWLSENIINPFNSLVDTVGNWLSENVVNPLTNFATTVGDTINDKFISPLNYFFSFEWLPDPVKAVLGIGGNSEGEESYDSKLGYLADAALNKSKELIEDSSEMIEKGVAFVKGLWPFAEGGIVNKPTPALVGEAGKEVILPLTKPGIIGKILSNLSSNEKRSLLSALLGIKNLSSENIFSNIISLLKNNKSTSAAQPRQNVLSSLPTNAVPGDDPVTIQKILSMAGPYSDLVYNNLLHGYKGNYKDGFKQRKKWYDEALVNAANQEGRDMIRGTYAERALDYGVSELGKPYILRALGKIGYVCNELVNACIQASGFDMGKFRINGVGATFRNINSGKMSGKGYPNFRIRNDLTPQTAMPGMLFFQDSRKNKEGGFQPGHIGLVYYGHQKLHASGGASSYKTSTFLRDWQTPCRGVTVTPFDNKSYVIGELPGLFEKANGEFSLPKNAQSIFGPVDISKDTTTNVNKAINNAGLLSNEEINAILNEAGKSNSTTMQQYITQAKDLMNSSNKNDVIAILTEIARYIKGIAIATKPKAVAVGKPPASVFGI